MRFIASTTQSTLQKKTQNGFGEKKLIEDSDVENTKRQSQRNYVVSRMYLKNYDISCLINSSAKSNSLVCYYIKQIMNVFIRAMVRIFS